MWQNEVLWGQRANSHVGEWVRASGWGGVPRRPPLRPHALHEVHSQEWLVLMVGGGSCIPWLLWTVWLLAVQWEELGVVTEGRDLAESKPKFPFRCYLRDCFLNLAQFHSEPQSFSLAARSIWITSLLDYWDVTFFRNILVFLQPSLVSKVCKFSK